MLIYGKLKLNLTNFNYSNEKIKNNRGEEISKTALDLMLSYFVKDKLIMGASSKRHIDEEKCDVYSRAAFNNIFACRCGVYSREAFIQVRRLFE